MNYFHFYVIVSGFRVIMVCLYNILYTDKTYRNCQIKLFLELCFCACNIFIAGFDDRTCEKLHFYQLFDIFCAF